MLTEEEKSCNKAVWRKFLQETSLHGCQKVSDPTRNKFVRTIWFFIIIVALSGWFFSSFFLFLGIKKYKVTTVVQSRYSKSLEFPSLTICSTCPINMAKVNMSQELLDLVMSTSEWEILKSVPDNTSDNAAYDEVIKEILNKAKLDVESTFLQMRWERDILNISTTLKKLHTVDGNCYLFNGAEQKDRFFAKYSGFETGLEVIVNTHQSSCPGGSFDKGGLKIYIHSSRDNILGISTAPSPDIMLSPGTSTNIGLRLTKTRFLQEPFTSVGNLYCNPTVNYSRTNCISDCVKEKVKSACICDEESTCTIKDMGCNKKYSKFSDLPYIGIYRIQAEKNEICDCSYPCVLTEYVTDLSFSYFPTDAVSERLVTLGEIPNVPYASHVILKWEFHQNCSAIQFWCWGDRLRKNLLKFNMNYKQLVEREIKYEPEYCLENILGTVGGLLGLFLGASVITATELFEACISFLVDKCSSLFTFGPSITKVKPFKP